MGAGTSSKGGGRYGGMPNPANPKYQSWANMGGGYNPYSGSLAAPPAPNAPNGNPLYSLYQQATNGLDIRPDYQKWLQSAQNPEYQSWANQRFGADLGSMLKQYGSAPGGNLAATLAGGYNPNAGMNDRMPMLTPDKAGWDAIARYQAGDKMPPSMPWGVGDPFQGRFGGGRGAFGKPSIGYGKPAVMPSPPMMQMQIPQALPSGPPQGVSAYNPRLSVSRW